MAPVDYEILLFFDTHPIKVSPKVLAVNIDYDRQYVSKRCVALTDAGLLESVETGLYEVSEMGDAFLEGEVDGRDLENPDE
ncbi:MarR family transcriptional regulator [Natronolimnobius sp. AArcel1]|nr:MarR family transcriptional regulator [Natronolimnobius sp. AArcel1]